MGTKARVSHIDIAKSFTLILVCAYHAYPVHDEMLLEFNRFCAAFRMPMFFFMSGVFVNLGRNFQKDCCVKFDGMIKPYFVASAMMLVTMFVSLQMGVEKVTWDRFTVNIFAVFTGDPIHLFWAPLWFLPHLFLVSVVGGVSVRHVSGSRLHVMVMMLTLCMVFAIAEMLRKPSVFGGEFGFSIVNDFDHLPYAVSSLPVSLLFYLMGYYFKKQVVDFKLNVILIAFSLIVLICLPYSHMKVVLATGDFYPEMEAILRAVAGIYLMVFVAYSFSKMRGASLVFLWVGQASLFVYIFHAFVKTLGKAVVEPVGLGEYAQWNLVFFMMIVIPTIAYHALKNKEVVKLFFFAHKKTTQYLMDHFKKM